MKSPMRSRRASSAHITITRPTPATVRRTGDGTGYGDGSGYGDGTGYGTGYGEG